MQSLQAVWENRKYAVVDVVVSIISMSQCSGVPVQSGIIDGE